HIVEDRDHRIWMATERFGLVELLNNEGTFSYKKMPLMANPNDFLFLRAIVEDNQGFLWLSSDKGVFKFDKNTLVSERFTVENGLHSNQFSFGASLKSRDGTIYFGGVNGYSFFNPATIKNTLDIENIKITKFLIFDEEVTPTPDGLLQQNISETEKITLNYDQTTIGLEFSELNFTGSAQKYYCYVLEGFDKEWFSNRAETSVRYTNLSPGNYTFKVRSSKNQQCVDSNTISLSITVLSPWWATWWFRVIVVIAVMTFMLFIHFYRILILKEQRKKLNDKVKERTEVIRKQNQKLAKSTEKLKQANEQLEGFAYVISHDLKAPLRGISSLSQWITNDYKDKLGESGIELFDLMISKVKWLEKLINDVLEYSKTGKSDRVFVTINLNEILNDVLNALETPAHFKIDIAPLFEFNGVRSEWYQILQNLISNAIKYNDKTEGIIKIYSSESEGKNCIHVWDNGIGISEKHYDKVFEVFQTLNDTPGVDSTGIGLSTVKKLVELNNAKITIKSELGIYSCFNIDIPLDTSDESV
ncbi:MAG: ATP-binding protein, partial [Cyclobacteriaceae bacterium]|nr:ATP-binding protein [Cyclobacteriaceae bacterium]